MVYIQDVTTQWTCFSRNPIFAGHAPNEWAVLGRVVQKPCINESGQLDNHVSQQLL